MRVNPVLLTLVLACAAACGGGEELAPPAEPASSSATSGGGDSTASPSHGLEVQGLLGTIPARKIEETMTNKLAALQRCFFEGANEVEFLAGRIDLFFRVDSAGKVEHVHAQHSTVGHRATELCVLGIAQRAQFPKPQGGDGAEFSWGFEIDAPGGVREPVSWDAERVETAIAAGRGSIAACGATGARYEVTAYVAPGGSVLGVGAATESYDAANKLDCIVTAIKSWSLPDPGSYPAKVHFTL